MKTTLLFASAAGLTAAQFSFNETTHKYTCAQPNQAYCVTSSMESNIILRCDSSAIGKPGNCNDNLAGESPMGNTYSPCWQTSNITGDAACSKNCVVYGGSGNYNGTTTLPAEECTPTYTATSSSATTTTATTLTQSVTISSSSASASSGSGTTAGSASETETTVVGTGTTISCTESGESQSSTASTGAVTGSPSSTVTTPAASATTVIPPPASPPSSNSPSGGGSPPPAGSTTSKPSNSGPGPVVTLTSTSSLTAVSTPAFPTAGAVSNHVGVGLGVLGLLVGAML